MGTLRMYMAGLVLLASGCGSSAVDGPPVLPWPPVRGEAYPELSLLDFRGERVELASFRGKVLLIEPIGMT